MLRLCSTDETNTGHAKAVDIERLFGGSNHCRVISKPNVVVGAKIDEILFAAEYVRCLGGVEQALALVQTRCLDVVERFLQIFLNTGVHRFSLRPIHDDFARIRRTGRGECVFPFTRRKAIGDDIANIEACLNE